MTKQAPSPLYTAAILLELLRLGPACGSDLMRMSKAKGLPGPTTGSLFPALAKLEREGLVKKVDVPDAGHGLRIHYDLTETGRVVAARSSDMVRGFYGSTPVDG